jgi:rubrerythrin
MIILKQNLSGGIDMHKMTEKHLKESFSGESEAYMKYLIFADAADKENKPNVARLFRAVAGAEKVHAANHLKVLGGIRSTEDNLKDALDGENFEVEEMYAVYEAAARLQGEKAAQRTMNYALEAEKIHADMYRDAAERVKTAGDIEISKIYVCTICGHTREGSLIDKCPVCGVGSDKFIEF